MSPIDNLKSLLQAETDIELAVLIGSRISGSINPYSDWDIAIRWVKQLKGFERLEKAEVIRQKIAHEVGIHPDKIDLIDITTTRLAMRAVIAEEGMILKGDETLAWCHFLTLTWAELEDYYWRQQHAA